MFEDVFALKPKMVKPVWKAARELANARHAARERGVAADWQLSAS